MSRPFHALAFAGLTAFWLGAIPLGCQKSTMTPTHPTSQATNAFAAFDPERFDARDADWRVGPIIYQVFVDRFVPPVDPAKQAAFFQPPRSFRSDWNRIPQPGTRVPDLGCSSHELEFWGGDLAGVRSKADYLKSLGVDVVYLNPIHAAFTNHKYDAQDYAAVSLEYGTRGDVSALAADCHTRGMKLMLDGVFNHMGRTAPRFQNAMRDPASPDRGWFIFDPACKNGYRAWYNVPNLPEVNLENPAVRDHVWESRDSVVRSYLREGVDGWRLDVAYDIGFDYLSAITRAAHAEKPGSAVIGEIWNYPEPWMPAMDGLMNFHQRQVLLDWFDGRIDGARAGELLDGMVRDTGIDHLLKCWTVLDNHDTPRLKNRIPDPALRRIARVLQFTLPGAPCVYYGSEVEMEGGDDPRNRAPMRWDLIAEGNEDLAFFRKLVELRRGSRGLRVGDWRLLSAKRLMAFQRYTDRWRDTAIVVVNTDSVSVKEVIPARDGRLMNFAPLLDVLSGQRIKVRTGLLELDVPARTAMVLVPTDDAGVEYSPYKRVP